jgi:hypothetical protein
MTPMFDKAPEVSVSFSLFVACSMTKFTFSMMIAVSFISSKNGVLFAATTFAVVRVSRTDSAIKSTSLVVVRSIVSFQNIEWIASAIESNTIETALYSSISVLLAITLDIAATVTVI